MSSKFKVGKDLINIAGNVDDLCPHQRLLVRVGICDVERLQRVRASSNRSSIIVEGWKISQWIDGKLELDEIGTVASQDIEGMESRIFWRELRLVPFRRQNEFL